MPDYTDELIRVLIECPKQVIRPPKKMMAERRRNRCNDMRLRCDANGQEFDVFIRVNMDFPENFSIGLRHCPPEGGRQELLRYNGPHGAFKARRGDQVHSASSHIHLADEDSIKAGLRADHGGEKTDEYGIAYTQALTCFLQRVNAKGAVGFFPELPRTAVKSLFVWADEGTVQ